MLAKLNALLHGAEAHRAYFYRLATVTGAALVALHFVASGTLSTALTVVGAILGVGSSGLAATNTTVKKPGETGAVNVGPVIQVLIVVLVVLAILWFVGIHVRIGG